MIMFQSYDYPDYVAIYFHYYHQVNKNIIEISHGSFGTILECKMERFEEYSSSGLNLCSLDDDPIQFLAWQ